MRVWCENGEFSCLHKSSKSFVYKGLKKMYFFVNCKIVSAHLVRKTDEKGEGYKWQEFRLDGSSQVRGQGID